MTGIVWYKEKFWKTKEVYNNLHVESLLFYVCLGGEQWFSFSFLFLPPTSEELGISGNRCGMQV